MRILVFGASGRTGQVLVRQALDAHHAVTAFLRDPQKLAVRGPGLQHVQGNVRDPAAVRQAVPGHDAVLCLLGVSTPLRHDPDVVLGVGHIVHAMQACGVRRLIYVSFIAVRDSRQSVGFVLRVLAPLALRREIADHEVKETLVRESGLDWTIVRPPKLTDGPCTGRYRSGEAIRSWAPLPMLSRADVAHFILRELVAPAYLHRAPRLLH